MKQINWLTVFFWSLIIVGLSLRIAYHLGYDTPRYSIILVVIGSLGLQAFHEPKKQKE